MQWCSGKKNEKEKVLGGGSHGFQIAKKKGGRSFGMTNCAPKKKEGGRRSETGKNPPRVIGDLSQKEVRASYSRSRFRPICGASAGEEGGRHWREKR